MNKSFGFYGLRYAGVMVLVMIAVTALLFAAFALFPDLANRYLSGNSGTGVVTAIVPALLVGQIFYREEKRKLMRGEGWKMAFMFTGIGFVVSFAAFVIFFITGGLGADVQNAFTELWQNGRDLVLISTVAMFVLYLLLNRFMLWSAIRGAIKVEAKQAAKDARNG